MKKTWKYIIAAGVIVGISFLYAHVDKKVPVYDKTVDTSLYGNMGELTQGLYVRQEFVCEKSVLDGLSLKIATFGNKLTSTYDFQIVDTESGDVVREGVLDASDVPNSKYYTIEFDQIEDCKDQRFTFVLESENAGQGNALTVYNVPKGGEDARLRLNSDEFVNNTLAMRTVSHMFDWETFISVIFVLAYLYVFLIVLFKFFS